MAFARSFWGARVFRPSSTQRPFVSRLLLSWRLSWRPAAVAATLAAAFSAAGCGPVTFNSADLSATPATPEATPPTMGTGAYKVGLILPFSASGNGGAIAASMRNAAEMALAEFGASDIQLLPKDDGGTAQGAQAAVQQALDEGAQVILGPLFSHTVTAAKPIARSRNVPMIAFSTDSNVAGPGTYLLSFLPESDVDRAVAYAVSQGKRSFISLVPATAYGSVAEAEFKQSVSRRGGRVVASERYGDDHNKVGDVAKAIAPSAAQGDALFIPDGDTAGDVVTALASAGVNLRQFTIMGTMLWDDPHISATISANAQLEGAIYAAPDPAGFHAFAERYRNRYRQEVQRPAELAFDAVSLIVSLAKAQPGQRITNEVLANPGGFNSTTDGLFRFRRDGTNQRGLAVLKVAPSGTPAQVVAPAVRSFSTSAT